MEGDSTMGGDLKYELLCPIGRKTERRHHHGSNKETHFYHQESIGFGYITLMFARVELEGEPVRTLTYLLTVNVSALGSPKSWTKGSPIDPAKVGEMITILLNEVRMITVLK